MAFHLADFNWPFFHFQAEEPKVQNFFFFNFYLQCIHAVLYFANWIESLLTQFTLGQSYF